MQVPNFLNAKIELLNLSEKDITSSQQAEKMAKTLIHLIEKFPNLKQDSESAKPLCNITAKLFTFKEVLSKALKPQVVSLFWSIHNLSSKEVPNLGKNKGTAEALLNKYKDLEALLPEHQQYPIPLHILKGEGLSCSTYFKPLTIQLKDGGEAIIARGLLAHYSDMVKAMLRNGNMLSTDALELKQLDKQQFDTLIAFLETSQKQLITKENANSLMLAAAYLQIPELLEASALYLQNFLNDETAVNLINTIPKTPRTEGIINNIESYISEKVKEGNGAYFKQNLIFPIRLSFAGSTNSKEILKKLEDFPVRELDLRGNDWVDDEALEMIPPQVEVLALANCKKFTKMGLQQLIHVKELDLSGCTQLSDEDFSSLSKDLRGLNIGFCPNAAEKALKRIGEMQHLETLTISEIKNLAKHLHHLPKSLIFLDAIGCGLGDGVLASFPKLHHLDLGSNLITDDGLKLLPESISWLSVNNCRNLTNKGVQELAKRKALEIVYLRRCPKITQDVLKEFNSSVEVGFDQPQPSRMAIK